MIVNTYKQSIVKIILTKNTDFYAYIKFNVYKNKILCACRKI